MVLIKKNNLQFKDEKLSKQEILDKQNVFVSSQATAYGEAVYKHEDL